MNEVYLITNRVNGKRYVGITCRGYLERFKEHVNESLNGSSTILHNAIRKYGPNNFDVILLESNIPDEVIEGREKHYISLYNTFYKNNIGYNMTEGGGGMCGYKHIEETRKKLSSSLKGHVFPESRNQKIKFAMTGRDYKPEWRQALSESRKGRFKGSENPFYGKQHTAEAKNAVSLANSKHTVVQIDPVTQEIINKFRNCTLAGEYVVSAGLAAAKPTTCGGRIGEVCRRGNSASTAYGFHWKFEERSID